MKDNGKTKCMQRTKDGHSNSLDILLMLQTGSSVQNEEKTLYSECTLPYSVFSLLLCRFFPCHTWADTWVICFIKDRFVKENFYCVSFQVFNTLQCQLAAAKQSSHSENTPNSSSSEASASSTGNIPSPTVMNKRLLTASMLLEKVDSATACYSGTGEKLNECCICLERKPDVMLPCAHSYCMPCIEQW
jgi:hypothetical protein